jgi:hypothetical protein
MDLSAEFVRDALHAVDLDGWDSAAGRQLLDHIRRAVVVPVVRRSGLRGPAADQAEASGWEAAWDALRRPSARTAENPGGMAWVAVRRAVAAEAGFARPPDGRPIGSQACAANAGKPPAGESAVPSAGRVGQGRRAHLQVLLASSDGRSPFLSLDDLMAGGWHPADTRVAPTQGHGPVISAVLEGLVDAGWDRADAADAIAIMADHAAPTRTGSPTTRWRWVSLRLGVPEWQARRLALLLLGGDGWPGILELVVRHGAQVIRDPAVLAAVQSTTSRWSAGPSAWLAGWDSHLEGVA